jgi:hypothetical protein
MRIIFSKTIGKREEINVLKNDIIKAFYKGIFTKIKGESLPTNSQLVKIYMTTIIGARRAVFLVDMVSHDSFFLFCRSKNDKIGENVTIKNKFFKETLVKYLGILREDISSGNIEIIETS